MQEKQNGRPFQVGILGCGNQAADHAAAYARLADRGVRVAAVADVNEQRAAAFAAEQTADAVAFRSVEAMLAGAELDAISVCVPNKFHHPATMAALEAGVHVLCEKPPALTLAEAQEMEQLADARDLVLTYGVLYRYMYEPLLPFAAELGTVYHAKASWLRLRGIPGWGIYGNKALQGGGAGIDLGVHVFDLAWWLMGRPAPRRVSARSFAHKARLSRVGLLGPWDPETFQVEDHMVAVVDTETARIELEATFAADLPDEEIARVELQGEHGRLVFRLMTAQTGPDPACAPRLYSERNGRLVEQVLHQPLPMTALAACSAQIERFVANCRGEAEVLVPARDGTVVQSVLAAIYKSAGRAGEQLLIG
jgi:predicted dehydrogenase